MIFIPGWSANGAMYFHLMHILSNHYHVYVLDVRNQGFSEKAASGNRISRYAMDVKEFAEHLGVPHAHYCGWSMGASVMWAYIDLFGTQGIRTLSIIDQAPSIYCHADWTEQQRLDAGAFTTSPERMIDSYVNMKWMNSVISDSVLFEYEKTEQGDHFLAFKNPQKFAADLHNFLQRS